MNHDKMMQIIHDVFHPSLPRLAPGDEHSTRRALEMLYGPDLGGVGEGFRALDIGCGNGAQTLRLATELEGKVTAVDNHQPYLEELDRRAKAQGLADRIEIRCADMIGLDLPDETFNLVWSEGSAFIMGIPEALRAWRSFLEPGGALGFSELTWLKDGVPDECRDFFAQEYPQMKDVSSNLTIIEECGYELIGQFTLPESAWWDSFYGPLAQRLDGYKAPWDDDETKDFVNMVRGEIDICRRFSQWYGYVFFLLRTRR